MNNDFSKIDKNFASPLITATDIVWRDGKESPFSLHGVTFDGERGGFVRMPTEIAKQVSPSVAILYAYTAGGRIRFKTNSPYIAIKGIVVNDPLLYHMPTVGSHGFSLYSDGIFQGVFSSDPRTMSLNKEETTDCFGMRELDGQMHDIELYFPLYTELRGIYVGLKEGCSLLPPKEYTYKLPVIFGGSSITQGGCASRPGNDYISHIERTLDTEILNLGFSGSFKGEKVMADYMASLSASVFVIDYDYNADTVEELESTHYPLYRTIRDANPNTPIIFISKPNVWTDYDLKRKEVIKKTYFKGLEEGDKLIEFIDGQTLFGTEDYDACTVDRTHPNDLGFYRMAQTIMPVIKKYLK